MAFMRHPQALWVISFGKIWDTFSYFGTQTILVLYLMQVFHLDKSSSYSLYGAYAALAFTAPILGGIMADKWIGSKSAIFSGIFFNILGNLIMMVSNRYLFCLGLATSLVGSGLYKSNATQLVGALYAKDDCRKEIGFTWFYLGINIGGTLGPLTYGIIVHFIDWPYVFLFSALGLFVSGMMLLMYQQKVHIELPFVRRSAKMFLFIYPLLLIICFLLSIVFYFYFLINPIVIMIFIAGIMSILIGIRHYRGKARQHLLSLLLISIIGMFYFSAGLQTGSMITLFIQDKIDAELINIKLPGSAFNSLYCLFVITLAPSFAILWAKLKQAGINFSVPTKIAMGIGFATLGIGVFALSTLLSVVLPSIFAGYLLLSAGEVSLTPTVYTAISNISPAGMQSTMMGCWLMFIALGGYLSSILANISHTVSQHFFCTATPYLGEFLFIAGFTFIMTIVATISIPFLKRMME